ncbi:hypothetical protein OH77DRAFT_1399717 [Trametes cingulata]|nr:hypothetical protein OH77DRAFT_1399717 [Trametes cingulata]
MRSEASLIAARVIGFLLLYPPSIEAQRTLVDELASCNNQRDSSQAVYELGMMYTRHLILIFKQSRGRTPAPSSRPSRRSFDALVADYRDNLQPTPRDHSSAKAAALVRDNYRCMLTGKWDLDAFAAQRVSPSPGDDYGYIQCCHIFPDSLGDVQYGGTGAKESEAATVWTILDRFGYSDICEEVGIGPSSGARVHRLENIMSLDATMRRQFDNLNIWFEAVPGQPHCYDVKHALGNVRDIFKTFPSRVQFVSHRAGLPLPSPRYLHIHATCCRVAHMSGAAEYVDRIFREMEANNVLAKDGTSAEVLSLALHRHLALTT